jgi:hypothetical protein
MKRLTLSYALALLLPVSALADGGLNRVLDMRERQLPPAQTSCAPAAMPAMKHQMKHQMPMQMGRCSMPICPACIPPASAVAAPADAAATHQH